MDRIEAYDDDWIIEGNIRRVNPVISINSKARIFYAQMFGRQGRFWILKGCISLVFLHHHFVVKVLLVISITILDHEDSGVLRATALLEPFC